MIADSQKLANEYRYHYQNGLQEFKIPKKKFDELVDQGVIKVDDLLRQEGKVAWHIPPGRLNEFNEALLPGIYTQD